MDWFKLLALDTKVTPKIPPKKEKKREKKRNDEGINVFWKGMSMRNS